MSALPLRGGAGGGGGQCRAERRGRGRPRVSGGAGRSGVVWGGQEGANPVTE